MVPKIGIIGDSMIDQYYSVQIKKISPEFPIPVMHSTNDECKSFPGGAANVAYQFLYFDVDAKLISFLDKEAEVEFKNKSINTKYCLLVKNKISRKKRFYSDNFPTYRWDVEDNLNDINNITQELYLNAKEIIPQLDAVIFSDYDKGSFSNDSALTNIVKDSKISVVDSKSLCADKWYGCTVFKSNFKEAQAISNKNDIVEAGFWIKSRMKCKYVVITNAEKGVYIIGGENKDNYWLKEIGQNLKISPAQSVIGAGDCFTAMLTYKLSLGNSIEDSVDFAWNAGINYVKNRFNSPVCQADLLKNKYIKNPKILLKRNFKLALANGCFDLLHVGHIELLKFAKSRADKLVVALNSDFSVSQIKDNRPILPLEDRIKIISSLEFVDFVISFNESTPLRIIQEINPDILIKGSEYDTKQIVGFDTVPEIVTFPMVEKKSTTNLIKKIKEKT